MSKASEVLSILKRLDEDKTDDHISFLKNHPHLPDSLKRKLDLLKKEKAALESQHDEYYAHWMQSGDEQSKNQVDAIDQKIDSVSKYIKDLVDQHAGLE